MTPEADMSPTVSAWMEKQGLAVYAEVPFYSSAVDLIGANDDRLVAVELKTSLSRSVRNQARLAQLITWETYAATPTTPSRSSFDDCKDAGIGILKVGHDQVDVVLAPQNRKKLATRYVTDRIRQHIAAMEPGGIGGFPTMKGIGPAQIVYDACERLRSAEPHVTWEELFKRVPNHYAHPRSMRGAMRVVRERRR